MSTATPLTTSISPSTPYPDTVIDQLNRQIDLIQKQVESTSSGISHMLTLIAILATGVSITLGLSIWRTKAYAKDLVDKSFLDFESKKVKPVLKYAQAQLDSLSSQGTRIILKTSHILLDETFQFSQKIYTQQLKSTSKTKDEKKTMLADREKAFREHKEVTQYLIASLSKDPMIVEDICQKLIALAGHEAVRLRADFILEHMRGLMSSWPPGSLTRMEIRSLIDELERNKRNDAGQ
jgi:hypothetical protein